MLPYVKVSLDEFERLSGAPHLWAMYLHMKFSMDLKSGMVRGTGHGGLAWSVIQAACERRTNRGAGEQIEKPTRGMVRNWGELLEKRGLLERKGNADAMVFLVRGHVRAFACQKQTSPGQRHSYAQANASGKQLILKEDLDEWRREIDAEKSANFAHGQEAINTSKQSSSHSGSEVDDGAPNTEAESHTHRGEGFIEIGPGASQASQLGLAGNEIDRDRPMGSEAQDCNDRPTASGAASVPPGSKVPKSTASRAVAGVGVGSAAGTSSLGESSPFGALIDAYVAEIKGVNGRVREKDRGALLRCAEEGVSVGLMRDAVGHAVMARARAGDSSQINVPYVVRCVETVRARLSALEARLRGDRGGDRGLMILARGLGLEPGLGESAQAFEARVSQALAARDAFGGAMADADRHDALDEEADRLAEEAAERARRREADAMARAAREAEKIRAAVENFRLQGGPVLVQRVAQIASRASRKG